MVDKLTDEAHATGAVNTLTKEGRKLVGHNTDVPGLQGRARQAGRPPEDAAPRAIVLGAGGGARAVVYGLIREGFQRVIVFNRHLHRGRGAGQALRAQRRAHGAAGDALARVDHRGRAGQDEGAGQRDLDRADGRRVAAARPRSSTPELLVLDLIYAKTRLLRDAAAAGCATADGEIDAAPPGRRRVHALDRAAGAARGHGRGPRRRARQGPPLGRGRAGGGPAEPRPTRAAEPAAG